MAENDVAGSSKDSGKKPKKRNIDEVGKVKGTSDQSKKRKTDEKNKIINDPIWGPIELDPLCMKIIDTPQFQRLRHIKQLGGCSFVYPGACHSRFEHSIGTSHLARMMGEELQKKHTKRKISKLEIRCLEVAGLCHDLGHGPFSHVFDQQFQEKCSNSWTHEDLAKEMLDIIFDTLEQNGVNDDEKKILDKRDFIKRLIKPPKKTKDLDKPYLYEIISNEENNIDVDKWDYFSRDCHMLGLHHNFQCQRSIKLARVVDNHISFPESEYFNLFDMFYTRFALHRKAYQHHAVKAVEMMMADALFKANKKLMFPPDKSTKKYLSESVYDMDAYMWATDDVLQQIRYLKPATTKKSDEDHGLEEAQEIIKRIYCRDLYKLIGEKRVKWSSGSELKPDDNLQNFVTTKMRAGKKQRKLFQIEKVVLHYGARRENPMDKVKFHSKEVDMKSIDMKDKKSDMVPTAFEQIYLRLYWKGSEKNAKHQALKKKIEQKFSDIDRFSYPTKDKKRLIGDLINM